MGDPYQNLVIKYRFESHRPIMDGINRIIQLYTPEIKKKRIHTEVIEMKEINVLRYLNIISTIFFKSNTVKNAFGNCVLYGGVHFPLLLCFKNDTFYVIFPTNLAMCIR
jgi:hypothetical protein